MAACPLTLATSSAVFTGTFRCVIDAMRVNRNIYLVDDDTAVCDAISVFLEASGYRVRTYLSAENFLEEVEPMAEGVILLDMRMTGMSGLSLQAELSHRRIEIPIIFISGHGDVQMSVRAIKGGAIDFLEKPFTNESLLKSICEAFSRADDSSKQLRDAAEASKHYNKLTAREREVMQHVVAGMANKDIAELLDLSKRTIEAHRYSIMKKMAADSLPELVRKYDMCQMIDR
jgi:FixJ family two-component response regulator